MKVKILNSSNSQEFILMVLKLVQINLLSFGSLSIALFSCIFRGKVFSFLLLFWVNSHELGAMAIWALAASCKDGKRLKFSCSSRSFSSFCGCFITTYIISSYCTFAVIHFTINPSISTYKFLVFIPNWCVIDLDQDSRHRRNHCYTFFFLLVYYQFLSILFISFISFYNLILKR